MQETVVTNLPSAAIWIIAISQLLLALGVIAVLALFGTQIIAILKEIRSAVEDMRREAMPPVLATLKNVKSMSDDTARTTHNVTTAADKVAHVVGSIVTRVESPAIRAAGLVAGLVTGARAAKNRKADDERKGGKRGFLR